MDDLISRETALDVLVTSPNFHTTLTRIEELPAVDAAPVVHGRWDLLITKYPAYLWQADASCSRCNHAKYNVWSGFFPNVPSEIARSTTQHYAKKIKLPNYCESCGAKMDGERRDDDALSGR